MREKLIVLEEQRFMVQEMVNNAKGSRRFEEVSALTRNLDELDKEISSLKKLVSGVEREMGGLICSRCLGCSPALVLGETESVYYLDS